MEFAAYLAGEPHSDHPECVSPVIAAFMRSWNDGMRSDAERERLKPWVVKVLHTRTTAADEQTRSWMALDWLIRVHTPAWLDLARRPDAARALRALPELTSTEILVGVQSVLDHARSEAAAAWAAAGAAAGDAARDAAGDAAWAAAGAAARDAAGDAAGDAAWDAAGAAAGAAAWAAAGAAAGAAARDALEPTVQQLQVSAFELLERMIAVGTPREAPVESRATVA